MIDNKKYTSLKEIADYLLVSTETIHNWIKKGSIPYHKIGRKYLFDLSEVDESIENYKVSQSNNKND